MEDTKVKKDDPVLLALVEAFAEAGIDACPGLRGRREMKSMLPTEKTPPKVRLSDQTVLLHGPPKVGKSTWCSQADGALFLATEAGLNSLEVFQVAVKDWKQFLEACKEVEGAKHQFRTIIVDTVDNAYRMCSEFICAKHKIEHESDLGYGKGFALVNTEFYRVLNKLSLLPYGLFLICHSQEKEIETRAGKHTRIVPTLPDKARRLVLSMVDIILYCDIETVVGADGKSSERRIMRTKPSETYEAGDRTGRLPDVIDLNYAKFVEAFERAEPGGKPAAPPAKRERTHYATDAQVNEFDGLVASLDIPPDMVKQRLAHFGAIEPNGVTREDMESILAKLREARDEKAKSEEAKE